MDYTATSPVALAAAALETLGADTSRYRAHDPGSAGRAASLIAGVL